MKSPKHKRSGEGDNWRKYFIPGVAAPHLSENFLWHPPNPSMNGTEGGMARIPDRLLGSTPKTLVWNDANSKLACILLAFPELNLARVGWNYWKILWVETVYFGRNMPVQILMEMFGKWRDVLHHETPQRWGWPCIIFANFSGFTACKGRQNGTGIYRRKEESPIWLCVIWIWIRINCSSNEL